MKKRVAILGSTGSIGTQALDVIRRFPDRFETEVLTANNNVNLLVRQAIEFQPNVVVIGNESHHANIREALANHPIKVYSGSEALKQVVQMDNIDTVLTAMVGYSGLIPTIKAVEAGKTIALANKETLVVAGELITKIAQAKNAHIYPVDSEHSAIFQCLQGEQFSPVEKIYLTASGGPFRTKTMKELKHVTREDALNHPNWEMGDKITIDSATMINKGFELIEARWLFGLNPKQIEVIVHPQSIIHSMVQFQDGSIKAQMGLPDMKLPIQYALAYPVRLPNNFPRFDFTDYPQLTFEKPNTKKFRNLALSFEALRQGGNMPCILNAANEVVVEAFLQNRTGFLAMTHIIEKVMKKAVFIKHPTLDDYMNTDKEVRIITESIINNQ